VDPELEWVYQAANGRSKSRNTPFEGHKYKGRAVYTIVGGEIVYQYGKE
jgi:dihydroorotase